jgi:hypothetical protein
MRTGIRRAQTGILIEKIKGWAPFALSSPREQFLNPTVANIFTRLALGQIVPDLIPSAAQISSESRSTK